MLESNMKPHSYSSEGIVLAKRNYAEADKILILYTKNLGKVGLIAKGIRRPRSRKRGHLEIFNKVSFQATNGHGIDLMTEAEVIEDFSEIRNNLKKVSLAYYFMEVIGKITQEGEENFEIYNLIINSLESLKTEKRLKDLRLSFVTKVLKILGYWPRGQDLPNPDEVLEEVVERQMSTMRVGKIISS